MVSYSQDVQVAAGRRSLREGPFTAGGYFALDGKRFGRKLIAAKASGVKKRTVRGGGRRGSLGPPGNGS